MAHSPPHQEVQTIRNCWDRSDCARSFEVALGHEGLALAKGDRRDYVVIDEACGLHALSKRILGVSAAEIRARMTDLNHEALPTIEQARELVRGGREKDLVWDRDRYDRAWQDAVAKAGIETAVEKERSERRQVANDRDAPAPIGIRGDGEQLWRAYNTTHNAEAFQESLTTRGLYLARVTEDDVRHSQTFNFTTKLQGAYSPILKEGEYVVLNERGRLYRLTERTTRDDPATIRKFMGALDTKPVGSVWETRREIEERRIKAIDPRPFTGTPAYKVNQGVSQAIHGVVRSVDKVYVGVGSSLQAAGQVTEFGANAVESLFAPRLTPEQKHEGERAVRTKAAESESKVDLSQLMADLAEQHRREELERTAPRQRDDRER
jgi:hypothetical protein